MRTRVFIAIPAAAALALAAPLAAYAADLSWVVGGGTKDWGDTTNWASHTTPANSGDSLTFATSGTDLTNNNYLDISVEKLTFDVSNPFQVVGNDIEIDAGTPSDGIDVIGGDITISPLIHTTGDQAVRVADGASLTFPSEFDVSSDILTFDVADDGVIAFGPASRLDGTGGAGEVVKVGAGPLIIGGGTGEIGGGGLQVQEGWLHASGDLTGTRVFIDGGNLSGGSVGNPALGVIQRLGVGDGTVSPGTTVGGSDIATLWIWDEFSANSTAVLDLQLDGTDSDVIHALNGVNVQGGTLQLTLTDAPAVGSTWDLVVQQNDGPFAASYRTSAGDAITEGEPFVEGGQRYQLTTVSGDGGQATQLTYLGIAPAPAAGTALPATGVDVSGPVAVAVLLVALGGMVLLRRRRTT
jgi:LPXTG-motif cell wall-anchored protein